MNEKHRDIDELLKTNVDRQLADFNYDRFAGKVARRLATDDLKHRPDRPILRSLAIAAAVILGLGTLTIALMYLKFSPAAKVVAPGHAIVVIADGRPQRALGHCEVQIHISEEPPAATEKPTRWCIVTLPEPPVEDVRPDRDALNLACLF